MNPQQTPPSHPATKLPSEGLVLAQGAEALIILTPTQNPHHKNIITKDRIKKGYRIKELDEKLRRQRTSSESKILEKAGRIINAPKVLKTEKFQIQMQYIPGERLSETLNEKPEKEQIQIIQAIAKQVSKLHENNIIHGDLTTSNIILIDKIQAEQVGSKKDVNIIKNKIVEHNKIVKNEPKIYIIDFGLSFISSRIEDKAVDLHLIKQALEAKHYQNWEKLYQEFIRTYNPKEKFQILERLKKVEARGRYKRCE